MPAFTLNKRVFVDLGGKDNKKAQIWTLPPLFYPNYVRSLLHQRLHILYHVSFLSEAIDQSLQRIHYDLNPSQVSGQITHHSPYVALKMEQLENQRNRNLQVNKVEILLISPPPKGN